jgi:glutaredoxin
MKAIVWSKTHCPFCVAAKDLLTRLNVEFEEKLVGQDYTKEQFFESNPGATTVPQIHLQGELIGGYDDLLLYIENTGFNGTGHTL